VVVGGGGFGVVGFGFNGLGDGFAVVEGGWGGAVLGVRNRASDGAMEGKEFGMASRLCAGALAQATIAKSNKTTRPIRPLRRERFRVRQIGQSVNTTLPRDISIRGSEGRGQVAPSVARREPQTSCYS
jgi:hypothetical protein